MGSRRWKMLGRAAVIVASSLLTLVSRSEAMELRWASGATDLRFSNAVRCTLTLRCTTAEEQLPGEFRIVFVGESESNDAVILIPTQLESGVAAPCLFSTPVTPEDQISRTRVAPLCDAAREPRARAAKFVMDVAADFRGRFKFVPLETETDPRSVDLLEVTTNGGTTRPYPPILFRASAVETGGTLQVTGKGVGLSTVGIARLSGTSETSTPLRIVTHDDTTFVAECASTAAASSNRLELVDDAGGIAAASVQVVPNSPLTPDPAADYFLVRFRPGRAKRPTGKDAGTPSEFVFSDDAMSRELAAAGVSDLQPVFPWFKATDTRSQNSIGEAVELEDLTDYYFARVAPGTEVGTSIVALRSNQDVLWVGADYGGRAAQFAPNDPLFTANKQWGLRNIGQTLCQQTATAGVDIQGESAWNRTTGSPTVRVAVLDTGIDTTHSELSGHVRAGPAFVNPAVPNSYDDDSFGHHGTAVSGIIAATGNDSIAMAGVAWQVTPWAIKVLRGSDAFSRASWVSQGISWASANGIPIICMGLGFPEAPCYAG